jgi:inosine-uridine nucleoside N-ribohydrolase
VRTFAAALLIPLALMAADPVPLIFDTDIGNDVDDALALAVIHALESRGEAKLLAVTITKDNRYAAPYIDIVDTFYGRPQVPIGVVKNGKTPEDSAMIRVPVESNKYARRGGAPGDAVEVLRKALGGAADGSVVIAQVGFSTNLARLLAADRELVARKVKLLSVMAGAFPTGPPEYNVKTDIPSAQKVFEEWPTPIVFSGFEIGKALLFPATAVEHGFTWVKDHPVADAYRAYMKMPYDRPTWDLTAVLYGVRGRVTVDEKGVTHFAEVAGGRHRYLLLGDKGRALEALVLLATQPRTERQ